MSFGIFALTVGGNVTWSVWYEDGDSNKLYIGTTSMGVKICNYADFMLQYSFSTCTKFTITKRDCREF